MRRRIWRGAAGTRESAKDVRRADESHASHENTSFSYFEPHRSHFEAYLGQNLRGSALTAALGEKKTARQPNSGEDAVRSVFFLLGSCSYVL